MYKYLSILILSLLISCKSNKPEQVAAETIFVDSLFPPKPKDTASLTAREVYIENQLGTFCNIEQIEYCVLLPLNEYKEDNKHDYERAKHVFQNNINTKYEIVVQGLFREDMNASLEYYFKNTYTIEDEEQGKIIQDKQVVKATNCFYAKGYYSNSEPDSRFIEITWLRKDDIVKYMATFAIADTAVWNKRLNIIIRSRSDIK
ncbi:MAG: hypothetical protein U0U67_12540 [Chitinophagales bacterium]